MESYFITGTGTGVGKTFITCALLSQLRQRGLNVAPMKPVASGMVEIDGALVNEDVHLLSLASGGDFAIADINPWCFRDAIAPHIAAQREGVVIDLDRIQSAFQRLQQHADGVLVEGAGGLLVPLTLTSDSRVDMADLAALLSLKVILVIGMQLGCLNHALLAAGAIQSRGLVLAGWVANCCTPEPMEALAENVDTLSRCLPAPCLGVVAYQPNRPVNALNLDVLINNES